MKLRAILSLIGLVPAALMGAAPLQAGAIHVLLCTGDGAVRSVTIPLDPAAPPAGGNPCCAKGCHTGSSRKRGSPCC